MSRAYFAFQEREQGIFKLDKIGNLLTSTLPSRFRKDNLIGLNYWNSVGFECSTHHLHNNYRGLFLHLTERFNTL